MPKKVILIMTDSQRKDMVGLSRFSIRHPIASHPHAQSRSSHSSLSTS